MKFIHMADMHFDAPFISLSSKEDLSTIRRLEQKEAFKKIIDYIKENKIDYLFICGDLYEHNYIRKSTIDYINKEFIRIINTKIFIIPGNHDPYIKNSYYEKYKFSENVYILKKELDVYEDENIKIYGVGFTDFFMERNPLLYEKIEKSSKPTILLGHLDINGVKDKFGYSYNPIQLTKLKELEFDYCALGHIHNSSFIKEDKIKYCGSTISLGFDEIGEHGVIVGEFLNNKLKTQFLKIDDRQFTEYEVNVENHTSDEEILEQINQIKFKDKQLVKIILIGSKNYNIDINKLLKLCLNENVIKIKDKTDINIDLEKLSKENSLKGYFVKRLKEKKDNGEISEEDFNQILQIGLNAM